MKSIEEAITEKFPDVIIHEVRKTPSLVFAYLVPFPHKTNTTKTISLNGPGME